MASATRTSAGGSGLGGSPLQDALKDFPSLPRSSRSLSLRADRSAPGGRPAMPVLIAAWSLGPSTRKATRANTPVRWHPRGAPRRPACLQDCLVGTKAPQHVASMTGNDDLPANAGQRPEWLDEHLEAKQLESNWSVTLSPRGQRDDHRVEPGAGWPIEQPHVPVDSPR